MRRTIVAGDRFHVGATTDAEIVAAVRIAQDRLRLVQTFIKVVSVDGAPVTDYPKGEFETLIKKEGDEISILVNSHSRGRQPITVIYKRCAAVSVLGRSRGAWWA
jgi:hypothetical protein